MEFMEMQMKIQGNYMEHTIPTWRCQHDPFPNCQVLEWDTEAQGLEVETGFKYSLDIKPPHDVDAWTLGQRVKDALQNEVFHGYYGKFTSFNPRSRRSNANQGRLDRIEAPPHCSNYLTPTYL